MEKWCHAWKHIFFQDFLFSFFYLRNFFFFSYVWNRVKLHFQGIKMFSGMKVSDLFFQAHIFSWMKTLTLIEFVFLGNRNFLFLLWTGKENIPKLFFFHFISHFPEKNTKHLVSRTGKKNSCEIFIFFIQGGFMCESDKNVVFQRNFFHVWVIFWFFFSCIKLRESFSGETYFQSEF